MLSEKTQMDFPHYCDLNGVIAKAISSMSSSLRFEGSMNENMGGIMTNFTPYPRIHFGFCSYTPLVSK